MLEVLLGSVDPKRAPSRSGHGCFGCQGDDSKRGQRGEDHVEAPGCWRLFRKSPDCLSGCLAFLPKPDGSNGPENEGHISRRWGTYTISYHTPKVYMAHKPFSGPFSP